MEGQDVMVKAGLERSIADQDEGVVAGHEVPLGYIQRCGPIFLGKVFGDLQLHVQSFVQVSFAVEGRREYL